MAKDPAVLFYSNDFLSGTYTMTNEQVGKYIRLLCLQHQKGKLTEKDMYYICTTYEVEIFGKFERDGEYYFNKRMFDEAEKRKKYSESRKKNISKRYETTYVEHMENEIENEDVIKEERIVSSSHEPTINEVKHFFDSNGFDIKDAENFYSYYSAQNWETKAGVSIKANWQRKVIGWMNNQKQYNKDQPKEKEIKKTNYSSPIMKELYGK